MSSSASLKPILKRLVPLQLISDDHLEPLAQKAMVADFNDNDTLIRKLPGPSQLYHYLLEGEIEYRISMMERTHLYHSDKDDWCRRPLEELVEAKGGSIRAKSPCRLLILSRQYVDELVSYSQNSAGHGSQLLTMSELSEAALIDDHFEQDWNEAFLHTPLATNLSPSELQIFFKLMEDREFEAGEQVIRENTPGDTFYLIKKGSVEVSCGVGGPLDEPIILWPGDYFGDESLIAGTPRNASVRMLEDGVLGCLDQIGFDETFRRALVKTIDDNDLAAMQDGRPSQWLDVRLPVEYRCDHRPDSVNRPVGTLRKHLSDLDPAVRYFVHPNGGTRSELATYLLRQHGLEAYLYDPQRRLAMG